MRHNRLEISIGKCHLTCQDTDTDMDIEMINWCIPNKYEKQITMFLTRLLITLSKFNDLSGDDVPFIPMSEKIKLSNKPF